MGKRILALVPAAGRGRRMGNAVPKQFLSLAGVPVLVHALRALEAIPLIDGIILTVPESDLEFCQADLIPRYSLTKVLQVLPGGIRRQDSVRNGLRAITPETELVVVHDGVRPFPPLDQVEAAIEQAFQCGAVVIAVPMRDTVKRVGDEGCVTQTVKRDQLWLAQTPQVFRVPILQQAHDHAERDGMDVTDDAELVEQVGHPVKVVAGRWDNIKVTTPEDLVIGEVILAARAGRVKNVESV